MCKLRSSTTASEIYDYVMAIEGLDDPVPPNSIQATYVGRVY